MIYLIAKVTLVLLALAAVAMLGRWWFRRSLIELTHTLDALTVSTPLRAKRGRSPRSAANLNIAHTEGVSAYSARLLQRAVGSAARF